MNHNSSPLPDREPWMADALCRQIDPELFFAETKGASPRVPKAICRQCPVQVECLEYALVHNETFGIWGGLTARERRDIRRSGRRSVA